MVPGTIRLRWRCAKSGAGPMSANDELLKRLAGFATPTLANALDDIGFEGVLAGLTQMVPGTRCVGRAVTVREITGRRGDFASEDFKVGQVSDAARGGDNAHLRHPRHLGVHLHWLLT